MNLASKILLNRIVMIVITGEEHHPGELSALLHSFNEDHCPLEITYPCGTKQTVQSAYVEGDGLKFETLVMPVKAAEFIVLDFDIMNPPTDKRKEGTQ